MQPIDQVSFGCRRKNIGYLWAIEHGAKTVYETDDDNILKVDEPASMQGMDFYVYNSTGRTPCSLACCLRCCLAHQTLCIDDLHLAG